jgi:Ca2+-binding RTX toxin-like protein
VHAYSNDSFLGFRDFTAPLSAGPGCHLTGDGAIECPHNGVPLQRVEIDLGDGNDKLRADDLRDRTVVYPAQPPPPPFLDIEAGDGDDDVRQRAFGVDPQKASNTRGGPGNDAVRGGGVLDGGPGHDQVTATTVYSIDVITGGDGDDVLDGGGAPDSISGGPGDDVMFEETDNCVYEGYCPHLGPPGTNYVPRENFYSKDGGTLDGGPGNDRMGAGVGTAMVLGGPGDDDIYSAVPLADGGDGNDTMRGGRQLRGGPGDDRLSGTPTWPPGASNHPCCRPTDVLDGGAGADQLAGGVVDAVLDGGEGGDVMAPGSGIDTLSYRTRDTGVKIDLSATGALASEGDRAEPGIERIEGSAGDDEIVAGTDPVHIDGWLGDDLIVGGPAGDTLSGGGHDDVVVGGAGDDDVDGGADSYPDPDDPRKTIRVRGNDLLDGGPGADRLTPGGGEDWVLAGSGDDDIEARERGRPRFGQVASYPLNHSHIVQMSGADQVFCGKGSDVLRADYADAIALDCEGPSEGTPRWRQVKVNLGKPTRLTVRCAWADARPCKGRATLRTASAAGSGDGPEERPAPLACVTKAGTTLARSSFRIRAGRVNYVFLKLTRTGERLLRKRGCLAVHATLAYTDVDRRAWQVTRTLVLKRRGFRVR